MRGRGLGKSCNQRFCPSRWVEFDISFIGHCNLGCIFASGKSMMFSLCCGFGKIALLEMVSALLAERNHILQSHDVIVVQQFGFQRLWDDLVDYRAQLVRAIRSSAPYSSSWSFHSSRWADSLDRSLHRPKLCNLRRPTFCVMAPVPLNL